MLRALFITGRKDRCLCKRNERDFAYDLGFATRSWRGGIAQGSFHVWHPRYDSRGDTRARSRRRGGRRAGGLWWIFSRDATSLT